MPDYRLGKIYRLDCLTTGLCYVGSTARETLAQRLSSHTSDYRLWLKGKYHYLSSFEILKSNNYQITLIENYPCDNKDQLTRQERIYTNQIECVNIMRNQGLISELGGKQGYMKHYQEQNSEQIQEQRIQYRKTHKEQIAEEGKKYYEQNSETIAEYKKQHYEANKERILEQKKEKHNCACGSCIRVCDKARHLKTQKHKNYLENLETNELTTSI